MAELLDKEPNNNHRHELSQSVDIVPDVDLQLQSAVLMAKTQNQVNHKFCGLIEYGKEVHADFSFFFYVLEDQLKKRAHNQAQRADTLDKYTIQLHFIHSMLIFRN